MSDVDEDNELVQMSLNERLRLVDIVYDGKDPVSIQIKRENGEDEENYGENLSPFLWIVKTFYKLWIIASEI